MRGRREGGTSEGRRRGGEQGEGRREGGGEREQGEGRSLEAKGWEGTDLK